MSLTHFSSNLPESPWWTHNHHPYPYPTMDTSHKNSIFSGDHHPQPTTSTFNFHTNTPDSQPQSTVDHLSKQPMFEKPLTPSDVGKLNRLVIPKQHAEKYFPLSSGDHSAAGDQQKGLLLSFEDETGKLWRFRYSYWNSSQSYVFTKGWSRFVKEKRLDAGDVVLFERHRFDCDRLFIGWRRRSTVASPVQDSVAVAPAASGGGGGGPINGWTTRVLYNYPCHHLPLSLPHSYQRDCLHAGSTNHNLENTQREVVAGGNPRRVRLFGVNLECPDESEPATSDGSSHGGYQYSSSNDFNHNMNFNFSQMGYQHQG